MRIEKHQFLILIERILLQIQTRRIDMCTEDVDPALYGIRPDHKKRHALSIIVRIDLVARFQLLPGSDHILQILEPCFFRLFHEICHAFPFGLAVTQKSLVLIRKIKYSFNFCCRIGLPCIFPFHLIPLLLTVYSCVIFIPDLNSLVRVDTILSPHCSPSFSDGGSRLPSHR